MKRLVATAAALVLCAAVGVFWWSRSSGSTGHRHGDTLPLIAYSTSTDVFVRSGNAPPRRLAQVQPGRRVALLQWSGDGRRLIWMTIGDQLDSDYNGFGTAELAADGRLVVDPHSDPVDHPGGEPDFPSPESPDGLLLLPLVPIDHGRSLVVSWRDAFAERSMLYTLTREWAVAPLFPGQPPGPAGDVQVSADQTTLAYASARRTQQDCRDTGVVRVDLLRHTARTIPLPVGPHDRWHVFGVWGGVDGGLSLAAVHGPHCATERRPGEPHVYRLDGTRWVETPAIAAVGVTGPYGWTLLGAGPVHREYGFLTAAKDLRLTAIDGTRRVDIAAQATAYAWAPVAG